MAETGSHSTLKIPLNHGIVIEEEFYEYALT